MDGTSDQSHYPPPPPPVLHPSPTPPETKTHALCAKSLTPPTSPFSPPLPPSPTLQTCQVPVAQLDGDAAGGGGGGWSSSGSNVQLPGVVPPAAAAAPAECAPCPSCPVCPAAPSVRGAAPPATALSAADSGLTCADFDMGECRQASLAQMAPHIIECSEAGEGGSQEVRV